MARITPKRDSDGNVAGNEWEDGGVQQIETSDSVLGGPPEQNLQRHSPPNYAFREIVERLGYLFQKIEAVARSIPGAAGRATTLVQGLIEIATQTEVNAGVDNQRAVTPATLKGRLDRIPTATAPPNASTTVRGLIELATFLETRTGSDNLRAVTPAGLKSALDNLPELPGNASEAVRGVIELANQTEARAGIDLLRAVSIARILDALRNGASFQASSTRRGTIEIATNAEAKESTNPRSDLAITPASLRDFFFSADW